MLSVKTIANHCKAINKSGQPCGGIPLEGKQYCYFHDPDSAEKRRVDRINGGKARMRILDKGTAASPRRVKIRGTADVLRLLTETINEVRTGTIEKPTANSVGYLSNIAIKCLEQVEVVKRLEKIETEVTRIKELANERQKKG